MTESRGYDQATHKRIEAAVRKSERMPNPLPEPVNTGAVYRVRRVILQDELLIDTPTTGRERLQNLEGQWITTDIQVPEIYKGAENLDDLGINDDVWIVPLNGKWYAVAAAAAGNDTDPSSKGCCGPCIAAVFMTIDDLYPKKFKVKTLPAELGGPEITLSYIGLLATPPAQITASDCYYWESDAFDFVTDDGTDQYIWRLVVGADGNSTCKAGYEVTVLYLVKVGSATVGPDLSEPRCEPGSLAAQFVQFESIEHFRARCGSRLWLRFPQFQQREAEAILPCSVCVSPVDVIDYDDLDACWQSVCDTLSKTELPGSIYIRLETIIPELDGDDEKRVRRASMRAKLDFDLADMKYKSSRATSLDDCAGSTPRPNNFKQCASINADSDLGEETPAFVNPHVYFEVSCIDADTIRVETFTSEEWKVSNDGSTDACSKTADLTLTTALAGVWNQHIHAVRVSPAVDLLVAEIQWSLSE